MSLHKFAEQVAANGRGDDSLLVHMTPDEVQRLQAFAEANGRSLTINPETGLPEAGFLSDLFKAVAPIALGAFLGPAGLGMSSMMAGVATGGITTLATGSLSRGLMAGLGAYGGAGLGESFMTAGGGMSAANAATTAQQQLSGANLALGEAMPAQAAEQFTKDAVARMTPSGAVSAGVSKAIADPMAFAKGNLGNLAYAAAPIMAGAMVPTTTKMPEPKNTGYIRQFDYNINPETGRPDPLYGMRAMTPVKASEFGDKTFQGQRDLFRQQNPNPYELGVGSLQPQPQQLQQPTPMAKGGIVALAGGGVPGYAGTEGSLVGGYKPSNEEIFNYFKTPGLTDAKIAQDMATFGVSAADIARATGTQGQEADYNTRFVKAVATPTTDTGEFMKAANAVGLQNQALANALQTSGLSQGAQYALTHQNIGPAVNTAETQGGLEGLSNNINYLANQANTQIGAGTLTAAKARENALMEMNKYGLNEADVLRATGKTVAELFKDKAVVPTCGFGMRLNAAGTACEPIVCGAGFQLNKAGTACEAKVSDTIVGGGGNDTIVGGGGNDTITTKKCEDGYHLSADGKSCIKNAPVIIDWKDCGTGYHWDKAAQACVVNTNATQNTTTIVDTPTSLITAPATSLPVGVSGTTGPSIFGGGATVNPNGTITTSPVIPGIPAGGFTGMTSLRDAYTTGGGSLGYIPKAPKTMAEFEQMYNKQTGDSLAAYNYLMGKGGGKYPTKSTASQIAVPYGEYVLGKKPAAAAAKPVVKTTTEIKGTPGQPQTYFNEAEYLAANPDVAAELKTGKSASGQPTKFKSGYEHYLMYGKAGGRAFTGDYAGYTTALALATAANSGGGGPGNTTSATTGNTVSDSNTANSITGLAAPADNSIAVADAVASPASSATPSGGSTSVGDGTAPGATSGDGDSAGDDAVGGYYSRGKLNYRSKDMAMGGATGYAMGGGLGSLGSYSDGGRLLRGPGDGVSDSIPATIGRRQQPARLADGEFVIPARIVSELGNGSTDAGAKKLYAMMDRVQRARGKTTGKNKVAANSRSDKYLPA